MKIHQLNVDEALKSLRSSAAGLSSSEAARRLQEFGPNCVEKVPQQQVLWRLLKEFTRFFSVILWCAAALAFLAEWFDPGQGMARIGYAVVAVILVSGVFAFWQEYRIEQTLAALQKLLPRQVMVLRDGQVVALPAEVIVVGDVILLEGGSNIPADCRLIEGFGVRVNNATVTGESASKALSLGPSRQEELIHAGNTFLAGTTVVSGQARAVVFATGSLTEFGRIARLSQTSVAVVSPLRHQLAYLSRLIAILAVGIGGLFFAVGTIIKVPFWEDFIFSIGIIIAMVPEGLLPTLTLALVLAAKRMARRHVLIRHLTSVETLGSATVICTDKTGTLTENCMRVRELLLGENLHSVSSADGLSELALRHPGFFKCASLCHDVKGDRREGSVRLLGDPTEIALVEMVGNGTAGLAASRRLDEIPFDSDRMRQSVVHEMPDGGPVLYTKGAPETVLPLCATIAEGEEQVRALDPPTRERIVTAQEVMASRGLRVLAFASKKLSPGFGNERLEEGLQFLGLAGLEDPPRAEVPGAVCTCSEAGIKVIMVTGDHPHTAEAIARQIGLIGRDSSDRPRVITGEQLRSLPAAGLQLALGEPEILFARVHADQKMRIVETLTRMGHVVAVTGDGVNDAPALKSAHIGIAMGSGTDVSKEAADMVLLDDNFASIVSAVAEGRAIFQNIRRFLTYVLVHNVAELVPYLAFAMFRIPLPLTPIQALSIDMGTDSLTALGLGVEKPDPRDMHQPPRQQSEKLLNWSVAMRAYLFLGVIEAAAGMGAYFAVLVGGGWTYGLHLAADEPLYLQATTACLSTIIVLQIVNVFLCRSPLRSVFTTGLFDNPLIVWGVLLEISLALAINYTRVGNWLLGTAPVPGGIWMLMITFGFVMLVLEELRKGIVRRFLQCQQRRRRHLDVTQG